MRGLGVPLFSKLGLYLFKEMSVLFLLCAFVSTGIIFLLRIVKLIETVITKDVPLFELLHLFSYMIPSFLIIILPTALLVAIILAFGRLSADSEIIAMKASGIRLSSLLWPVGVFSFLVLFMSLFCSLWLSPKASYRFGLGMFKAVKQKISAGISEGVFNQLGTMTVYAERVTDRGDSLEGVMIGDNRDPSVERVFLAKKGRITSSSKSRSVRIKLFDGVFFEGIGSEENITYFKINDIAIGHDELLGEDEHSRGKRIREMTMSELSSEIKDIEALPKPLGKEDKRHLNRCRVKLLKRYTVPTSCMFIMLMGVGLGIQPARSSGSLGLGFCIFMGVLSVIIYFLLISFSSALVLYDVQPLIMWLPNIIFLIFSIWIFYKIESEQWQAFGHVIWDWGQRQCDAFVLRFFKKKEL